MNERTREPEDVQNRVRNTLGPIQTLADICEILQDNDPDSKMFKQTLNFLLKRPWITANVHKSIQHLIDISVAVDKKIDDKMYCVEDHIQALESENKNIII